MKLNATLLAAALVLALVPFASRADDKKPITTTDKDVTQADEPSQSMNRDSTMKTAASRGSMDRKDMTMTDDQVLRHLHHANLEEIKAGQMAQSKASSADVKDYARTLVTDHQQADKQVLAMADKMHVDMKKNMDMDHSKMDHSKMDHSKMDQSKMDPSAKMGQSNANTDTSSMDHSQTAGMDQDKMKMHQAKMDELQKMSGKDFDRGFLTMMANGHDHVISMVKNAQSSAKGDLKNMLDQMLPTLERHEQIAQDLMKKVGNTASAK
jgi:predicted outer membrane protein